MQRITLAVASFVAFIAAVVGAHLGAESLRGHTPPATLAAASGFEVGQVTGVDGQSAELLRRFAAEGLLNAQVAGSYQIDVTVTVTDPDDKLTAMVRLLWWVKSSDGRTIGVWRQSERVPLVDLNDGPERVWPLAGQAAGVAIGQIITDWENRKTRPQQAGIGL